MDAYCHCGTPAGYPHDPRCPFPLFTGSEPSAEWNDGWALREQIIADARARSHLNPLKEAEIGGWQEA